MKYAPKGFVFGIVCLITWLAMGPVRAKLSSARPLAKAPGRIVGSIKLLAGDQPPALKNPVLSDTLRSYGFSRGFSANLVGFRQVAVGATAALGDLEPGYAYMWVLRIKPEGSPNWITTPYAAQVFEVRPVREMTPTFHRAIAP